MLFQSIEDKKAYKLKNAVVTHLDDLIKSAKYRNASPDKKNNPMIKRYHYISVNAQGVNLYLNIRETLRGEFNLYSITNNLKQKS